MFDTEVLVTDVRADNSAYLHWYIFLCIPDPCAVLERNGLPHLGIINTIVVQC